MTSRTRQQDPIDDFVDLTEGARTGNKISPADKSRTTQNFQLSRAERAHFAKRPPRISMASGSKLGISGEMMTQIKAANRHPRWIQDRDGRLSQALAAYWEFVVDEFGNNVVRPSGPYKMFLMCLEDQYYQEDKLLKAGKITDTLKSEHTHVGEGDYIPDDRKSVVSQVPE